MRAHEKDEYRLAELVELGGVPARTVRLYITRGLLPPPLRAGPRAAYGAQHLERLEEIRKLQAKGWTLARIAAKFGGEADEPGVPQPQQTLTYAIAEDVMVLVTSRGDPARLRRISRALRRLAIDLHDHENQQGDEDDDDER